MESQIKFDYDNSSYTINGTYNKAVIYRSDGNYFYQFHPKYDGTIIFDKHCLVKDGKIKLDEINSMIVYSDTSMIIYTKNDTGTFVEKVISY